MRETTRAAVEWWAQFVSGRFGSKDMGDDPDGTVMMLATLALAPETADAEPEEVAVFKEHLAVVIDTQLDRSPDIAVSIGVDYGPDMTLIRACEAAGITKLGGFPWKTMMWVTAEYVALAEGYGARPRVIFGEKPCRDCVAYLPDLVDDGYGFMRSAFSEPTGKLVKHEENPAWRPSERRVPHTISTILDEPCPSCHGTLVQRPEVAVS